MRELIRLGRNRDLRVDLARGISLWFIFINHVPGNRLAELTPRNYALSDATEAFVLLAGYAAAVSYGALMDRAGWAYAAAHVIRRTGTLYVAHILLFVVFIAQVGYSAAALDSQAYVEEMQMGAFGAEPYRALLEALLLRFQPSFLNILPMYIVVLLMLALALPLLRRPAWLMGASLSLYALVRLFDLNLPGWTGEGWFFNPLAWQVLFFTGCVLGYRPPSGEPPSVPYRSWLMAACIVVLALGAVAMVIAWRPALMERVPGAVAQLLNAIDKTSLHPLRLISMLALTYVVAMAVPRGARWLESRAAAPLVLIGQQGLPVFCSGIFLSFLGRLALEQDDGWGMQFAVNVLGLLALVAIGAIAAWYRGEPPPRRAQTAAGTSGSLPAATAAHRNSD
jgi:hypothetical protein